MKFILLSAILTLSIGSASAGVIANCPSFEHHGNDIEIKESAGKLTLNIYNDSEEENETSKLIITKNGAPLKEVGAQSWAIRKAIKGSKEMDQSGVVIIKTTIRGKSVIINLNTFAGGNFSVIGDYVQALDCK